MMSVNQAIQKLMKLHNALGYHLSAPAAIYIQPAQIQLAGLT